MIIKKIKSSKRKRKGQHVSDLVRYIAEADAGDDHRVGMVGSREFLTSTLDGKIAEMTALASECVKSKNPINHYVVSWREGEKPTFQQLDQAVEILMSEMGLVGCQAIYAAHFDTRNVHLHLAVNRVDPDTLKTREINRGFDLDAGLQAMARIEHVQGWQSEAGALYHVVDGDVVPVGLEPGQERLPRGAKQAEVHQGEKSWARIAQERSESVWGQMTSWQQLHAALEAQGIRYRKKGSGAILEIEGQQLKATTVSRMASLSKLEKELGPFEPFLEKNHEYITHTPQPYFGPNRDGLGHGMRKLSECHLAGHRQGRSQGLLPPLAQLDRRAVERLRRESGLDAGPDRGRRGSGRPIDELPDWGAFQEARRERRELLASQKLALSKAQEAEWALLRGRQAAVRAELQAGDWRRRGHQLNALRAAIREDHEQQRQLLKSAHKVQREQLRERLKPWPTWRDWLADQGATEALEVVRYRQVQLVFIVGIEHVPLQPFDLPDYDWIVAKDAIHYRRAGSRDIAFSDRGQHITVWDNQDDEALLAALQLASTKWPAFEVKGDEAFKERCVRLAALHALPLANPELLSALQSERIALGLASQALKMPGVEQEERPDQDDGIKSESETAHEFEPDDEDAGMGM